MTNMPAVPEDSDRDLYSVGKVAEETQLSPDMLRVWERRYGTPQPIRLSSGHRRYTRNQVVWLRRVAQGLSRGYRPQQLLCLTQQELEKLLESTDGRRLPNEEILQWIDLIRTFSTDELVESLARCAEGRPLTGFLDGKIAPLLSEIGHAWARDELGIRAEHFATQLVEDRLRSIRESLVKGRGSQSIRGRILLVTLPGEEHGLGLQMAACLCEDLAVHAVVLGTNAPISEIVRAATETAVDAVGISISSAAKRIDSDRLLSDLRQSLPPSVLLVVGGAGARKGRRGPRGIDTFHDFNVFSDWLRSELPSSRGGPKSLQ